MNKDTKYKQIIYPNRFQKKWMNCLIKNSRTGRVNTALSCNTSKTEKDRVLESLRPG